MHVKIILDMSVLQVFNVSGKIYEEHSVQYSTSNEGGSWAIPGEKYNPL